MSVHPQQPELAPAGRSKLAALRRRIRCYVWLHGLAGGLAWLGVAFWASIAVDWIFEPPVAVRCLILGVVTVVLAWVLFRLILRRAFARLSDRNMAMLLERHNARFDDSLLTAVELTASGGDPGDYNREMLEMTCRRAVEPIDEVRLGRLFDYGPLRLNVFAAVLLAAGIGVFVVQLPDAFALWSRRSLLFSDELWPRQTRLVMEGFEDGVAKVARGSDLEVIAKADLNMPLVPDVVKLHYGTEEVRESRPEKSLNAEDLLRSLLPDSRLWATMSREGTVDPGKDEFQEYSHTFKRVLAPIRLDVVGGDAAIRDLRIEVVDSPTIVDMVLECRFPEYMDRPPRTLPVIGVMQVPRGTQVTVKATANKDLVKVKIDDGGKTHVHLHDARRLMEDVLEQQRRIRQRTAAGDDRRWLAGYQESLVGYLDMLVQYIEQESGEGPRIGSRDWQLASQRLADARRYLARALAELRTDNRDDVLEAQARAIDELNKADNKLGPPLSFRDFSFRMPELSEDKTLLLTLFDTDQISSPEPVRLTLATVADQWPELTVQLAGIGSAITPKARLPVTGRVVDDYGIAGIWFEYAIDENDVRLHPIAAPSANSTEFELDAALEVRDLSLTPGQKILLSVNAADRYNLASRADPVTGYQWLTELLILGKLHKTNLGSSDRWLLDVVTERELRTMLEARELVLRQRFERIIQEVTETRGSLVGIDSDPGVDANQTDGSERDGAEPGDEPNDQREPSPQRLSALRTLRVQRALQNSRKSAHETSALSRAFGDIRQELVNNRIDTEELKTRLQDGIADPLRNVAEEMFPELEGRLNRLEESIAGERIDPQLRDQAVTQLDAILTEMRQVLDRMLELEDFNKAVELLRQILQAHEELSDETKQRHKQDLRGLLED